MNCGSRRARRRAPRLLGLFGAIVAAVVGVCGCGGAGASDVVVARVRGNVITKAMFDHWMGITAVRDYEPYPRGPVPRGVVPDPPSYRACIGHLRASLGKPGEPPRSATATALRQRCAQQYAMLRAQVLQSLITTEWVIGEGEELGLDPSGAEIERKSRQIRHSEFASEAAFRAYLKYTGETLADQLFRGKVKAVSAKIERRLEGEGRTLKARQQAFAAFSRRFPRRWAARTSCRSGYVVPDCREYRGPSAPEAILP